MVINIKFLIFITLILLFLPSFCFIIGSQFIPVFIPAILGIFFILAIFYPKQLISNTLYFYKKTPFKYLVIFFVWSITTIIVSIFRGKFFIGGFITSTLGGLLCSVMLPCLFTFFVTSKYINTKTFIKFLYLFFWFIFLLGILDFIIFYFDIPLLKEIITIFSNKRLLTLETTEATRFLVGNFPRARSIFDEPSFLGYFIFVVSPLVYEWTLNEFKIFKNNYLNLLIKRTIIPFMWISLVLTQSPIFLIFNIIFSSFYFLVIKKGYKKLVKLFIPISISLIFISIIIIFSTSKIDFSTTYINRIILVIQNIKSFEDFIMVEPSLGTRIIIIINAIQMGLHNIFTGVGYGNMSYLIADQLSQSTMPMTDELQRFVFLDKTTPASTIFIKVFSETGILGTFIFYYFLIKEIIILNKLKYIFNGKEKFIISSFKLFLIVYLLSTLYSSLLNDTYIWLIIGFILAYTNFYIQRIKNGTKK